MRARLTLLSALFFCGCPDEPPVDTVSQPRPLRPSGPERPKEAPEPSPPKGGWSEARVGDRVELHASGDRQWNRERDPSQPQQQSWSAHYALEVVKLEPLTVWVKVQVWRADGSIAEGLIPVEPAPGPPLQHPQGAKVSSDEVKVGELSIRCSKWALDERPADGPLTEGCVSEQPPMYLTGTVYQRLEGSGFMGVRESGEVTLLAAVRGKAGESGALPDLPVLFPQNAWWVSLPADPHDNGGVGWQHDAQVRGRQVVSRQRQLTQVLRTVADLGRSDLFVLGDHHLEASPWHETSTGLTDTLSELAGLPGPRAGGKAETLHSQRGDFAVVRTQEGVYFADPFDRKLDGLPWPARAGMADGVTDWGKGELPPLPPAPGTVPEVLSVEEVRAKVNALKDGAHCPKAKPRKGAPGEWEVSVFVDAPVEGKPGTRVQPGPGQEPPAALLKCFEAALRKLTLPAHTQPQKPIEVGVTL